MLKLGSLELGALPRIAVPFTDRASRAEVQALRRRGLDVAELRVDRFASAEPAHALAELDKFTGLPTLATIRSRAEGGGWTGSERARLALFRALAAHVGAVDVELAAAEIRAEVIGAARSAGALAVVSHHDFAKTPEAGALDEVVSRALEAGADVVKIATAVRDAADLRALASTAIAHAASNLIVIGMGEAGLASRLLFAALGSLLTYAFAGEATAPGQLPFDEMLALMRRLFPAYDAAKAAELARLASV
jgi:3-dehydroquinate dehydratase-1